MEKKNKPNLIAGKQSTTPKCYPKKPHGCYCTRETKTKKTKTKQTNLKPKPKALGREGLSGDVQISK